MDPLVIAAIIAALASILTAVITTRQGKKINETHRQVSENSHKNEKPTVLDLISEVKAEVSDVKDEQQRVRAELLKLKSSTGRAIERHLEWHMEGNK